MKGHPQPSLRNALLFLIPVTLLWSGLLGQTGEESYRFRPDSEYENLAAKTTYQRFLEEESVPVYKGWAVDMYKLELKPWKRHGEGIWGAYANLEGMGGAVDNWVMEIQPGASTKPIRHIYEEHIIALSGEGETHIWRDSDPDNKAVVRWKKGFIFAPPLNTWHQHFNKGSQPARIAAETTLPLIIDVFRTRDFVFNNSYDFVDRYASQPDYFDPENSIDFGPTVDHHSLSIVNVVRNAWTYRLFRAGQGYKDVDRHFVMSKSGMPSHIEQFPVGTYERGHRHNAGNTIILLSGTGYTLLWPLETTATPWKNGYADQVERVDWGPGILFVPPTQWYHQHFNNGQDPARFIKLGGPPGNEMFSVTAEGLSTEDNIQVSYKDEDPRIRESFIEELARHGAKIRMPPREELLRLEEEAGGKFILLPLDEYGPTDNN